MLAIDPSSERSGGSILGDKTRMPELARSEKSFIRASPASGTLGGVARRTRDAMIACEAAGFDLVMVETVGVGQSEAAVADMTDLYMLLVQPGAGDELQGIKRGVMERADIVVVTKADGALEGAGCPCQGGLRGRAFAPRGRGALDALASSPALRMEGTGLDEIADAVERHRAALAKDGALEAKRANQAGAWLWREVEDSLVAALHADARLAPAVAALEAQVMAQTLTPGAAARQIVQRLLNRGE